MLGGQDYEAGWVAREFMQLLCNCDRMVAPHMGGTLGEEELPKEGLRGRGL